jgi:hypothetical protein
MFAQLQAPLREVGFKLPFFRFVHNHSDCWWMMSNESNHQKKFFAAAAAAETEQR